MLEKLIEISGETGKPISELAREAIHWSLLGRLLSKYPKRRYRLTRKNAEGAQKT